MELSLSSPSGRSERIRLLAIGLILGLAVSACAGAGDDPEGAEPSADELASTDEPDGDQDPEDGAGQLPDGVPESFFDGSVTVVVPNSPGTLSTQGRQRVMTALVGNGPNAYLGGPELPVTVRYTFLDEDIVDVDQEGDAVVLGEVGGRWLSTNASQLGLYVAPYSFDRAGRWQVTVLAGGREVGGALIEVVDESAVPNIGDRAPVSASPTGSTLAELITISTDPRPDPSLYDLSLDDALTNGRPTVVAFATPAFCRTALCGPTLETVKTAAVGRTDIDVVHIEPFDIEKAIGGLLEPIPTMDDWGLVSEPWVFVVDGDGRITAGFEGIIGLDELEAALDQL